MEKELQHLNPKLPGPQPSPAILLEDPSYKDDRPLLKSDSSKSSQQSNGNNNIEELEKKFAAFVRSDVYGPMGRGELPLKEKVLLGVAMLTLVPVRLVVGMSILLFYYLICKVCTLLKAPNRDEEDEQEDYAHLGGWRRTVMVGSGRFLSRVMLFVLGFYWISVTRRDFLSEEKSATQVLRLLPLFFSLILNFLA